MTAGPPPEIGQFIAYVREAANRLRSAGVQERSWTDDSGLTVNGWQIEYGDSPQHEDLNPKRTPMYMGGYWGHWYQILGVDGFIYLYRFRGEDTYENGAIVTTLRNSLQKQTLASLRGSGEPFLAVRRKIDALIGSTYEW